MSGEAYEAGDALLDLLAERLIAFSAEYERVCGVHYERLQILAGDDPSFAEEARTDLMVYAVAARVLRELAAVFRPPTSNREERVA